MFDCSESLLSPCVIKQGCIHNLIEQELLVQFSGMCLCFLEHFASMADLCSKTSVWVALEKFFITCFNTRVCLGVIE